MDTYASVQISMIPRTKEIKHVSVTDQDIEDGKLLRHLYSPSSCAAEQLAAK